MKQKINIALNYVMHNFNWILCLDSPMVSLVRSGSFMSAPKQTTVVKKGSIDGNGGGASDDSMHEKYFKSVENTPVSKRRNQSLSACTNQKHSSDSSPHSPMSPKKNVIITPFICYACYSINFDIFSIEPIVQHSINIINTYVNTGLI